MRDPIDREQIRKAIDRIQAEHPCHFTFDVTLFDRDTDFSAINRAIDIVAKKCQDDAEINIICEFAKLYLEGVRPTVEPKQGEWKPHEYDRNWVVCSLCGVYVDMCYNFCPNCGARMKEGDEK